MNLIANSGIQYFTTQIEINLNDNFKMYFHEWFDIEEEQLKLEIAHFFSEDDIWVRKHDLADLGYLQLRDEEIDGKTVKAGTVVEKWEEIKKENDYLLGKYKPITPMEAEAGETDCFQMTLHRCRFEKFEKRWFPFPFFALSGNRISEFGPTNWCRFKLIPDSTSGNIKKYHLLLAFDTRTKYEQEDFEDEDLMETPVFASAYDMSKDFALCNNEFSLVDFCSKLRNCEWVDEYVLDSYHHVTNLDHANINKPKMSYLAQYIFIIRYIQRMNALPKITLFSDKDVAFGDVDLIVDIGNSRTCAVLLDNFDTHDFTKVEPLALQNFTNPVKNGKLNRCSDSFDMRLAFREADLGGALPIGSSQFVFPSMVRLGIEANELIHSAINMNTGIEKVTTFSSPKRFLWDNKPQQKEWEFVSLKGEQSKLIHIRGISEQVRADGSLNTDSGSRIVNCYSRKALMTFGLLEIMAQAKMQMNSYEFRHKWGEENKPRRIGRVIVTCPTAMSRVEQIALRTCAEDAAIILNRFYSGTYAKSFDEKEARKSVHVIPSAHHLKNTEERTEWIYDEATCAQFVYLFAEINKRYRNNCKEYFDFYGKVRKDLNDYTKKSLTLGSVDIGAGTTDVMIAAYKYDDAGQYTLTPVPMFWESFYIAGDDLLKNLIGKLIIAGPHGAIQKQLEKGGNADVKTKILDFFEQDNARQSVTDRRIRSEFNLQVSVPVVSRFLELLNEHNVEKTTLSFDDIFLTNRPTEQVLEHFKNHFGFAIEDLPWHYDKTIISKIVESTFDTLVGKIATVLSYWGCDVVLLTGRPSSLTPLSDLFLKYYAVSPNRLITLNNYRIGTWYPFQNGKGYFKDAKSIVAIGAMIGNYAATRGSLDGFSLDLSELIQKMLPTTDYFVQSEKDHHPFITPEINSVAIEVLQTPLRIWTRQLNSPSYPTRPFYIVDLNKDEIERRIKDKYGLENGDRKEIKDTVDRELERLQKLRPYKFIIVRENYFDDKETLKIESVEDRNNENIPTSYFSLQVQSMGETNNYWLDSGEFTNLNIHHN